MYSDFDCKSKRAEWFIFSHCKSCKYCGGQSKQEHHDAGCLKGPDLHNMCNLALAFELYHLSSCRQSTLFQTVCGGSKGGVLWLTANLPTTCSCSEAGTGMAAVTRIESATSVLGFSALGVDWWTMSWTICELICTNLFVSSPFMHFGDLHQVCQAPANIFHDCAQENTTHQDKLYSSCRQYRDYNCLPLLEAFSGCMGGIPQSGRLSSGSCRRSFHLEQNKTSPFKKIRANQGITITAHWPTSDLRFTGLFWVKPLCAMCIAVSMLLRQ